MLKRYNVEEFIKNHKHINYCECIIDSDGLIMYVEPSHIETMIKISGEPKDIINQKMPMDALPVNWLSDYTNCIAVWFKGFVKPKAISTQQRAALNQLVEAGIVEMRNFRAEDISEELLDSIAVMNDLLTSKDKEVLSEILKASSLKEGDMEQLLKKLS